jgi:hypothetical protein
MGRPAGLVGFDAADRPGGGPTFRFSQHAVRLKLRRENAIADVKS